MDWNIFGTGLYFLIAGIIGQSYSTYLQETMDDELPAMFIMIAIYAGVWFMYYLLKGVF